MESLFTITQNWKQLQYPSTAEWIKKKKKYNGILLSKWKKLIYSATWVYLKYILLTEGSQSQKYILHDFIYTTHWKKQKCRDKK